MWSFETSWRCLDSLHEIRRGNKGLDWFSCLHREEHQSVVDVILSRREDFRVFDTYISEYDRSMSLLEESCRDNQAFASIVKKFEVHKELNKAALTVSCHVCTHVFLPLPESALSLGFVTSFHWEILAFLSLHHLHLLHGTDLSGRYTQLFFFECETSQQK